MVDSRESWLISQHREISPLLRRFDSNSVTVGAPTGARSKRKALTAALPQRFRETEEKFGDLDDLVIQFGTTEVGKQFVAAWFNARHVADLGRRSAKPKEPSLP